MWADVNWFNKQVIPLSFSSKHRDHQRIFHFSVSLHVHTHNVLCELSAVVILVTMSWTISPWTITPLHRETIHIHRYSVTSNKSKDIFMWADVNWLNKHNIIHFIKFSTTTDPSWTNVFHFSVPLRNDTQNDYAWLWTRLFISHDCELMNPLLLKEKSCMCSPEILSQR